MIDKATGFLDREYDWIGRYTVLTERQIMRLLYLKLTNSYSEHFAYQENILPAEFVALGYDTYLMATTRSLNSEGKHILQKETKYINGSGVNVWLISPAFGRIKAFRQLGIYRKLYSNICEIKPDVIFVHSPQFLSLSSVCRYVKRHPNVTVYIDNHADSYNTQVDTLLQKFFQKVLVGRRVREIEPFVRMFYGVAPCRSSFLNLVYGVAYDKITTIKQGGDERVINKINREIERKRLFSTLNIKQESFLVVTGGGVIDIKKKIQDVIKAIEGNEKIELVVFGSFTEQVLAICGDSLNKGNIHYVGKVSGDETYLYLTIADLVVFPGTHSVMWDQTMACGTPALLKRIAGLDYFNIGKNCDYLETGSVEEIIDKITEIVNDPSKYHEMLQSARKEAKPMFQYCNIAKDILRYETQ